MITDRTNPRNNVFLWLSEIASVAKGEKAEITEDRVRSLAEPILTMAASSKAPDPEKMRELLESGGYPRKVEQYLRKNWFLNIGIQEVTHNASSAALFRLRSEEASRKALAAVIEGLGEVTSLSPMGLGERIEEICNARFRPTGHKYVDDQGPGTPILIREALGLPGDLEDCPEEASPEVARNLATALEQIGVSVSPDLTAAEDEVSP